MTQFLKNSDPRFHLVELRSKTFVFLLAVLILSIVGFAALKQEWFRQTKPYWMTAETSEGLKQGMSVRLSGFSIGRVNKITLEADRRVRVDLEIFDEYSDHVRIDTVAKLRGENIIGDRFIELSIPSDSANSPPLPQKSRITYEQGKTIDELVESLEMKFTPILTGLGSLAKSLPNTVKKLDSTLDGANGLMTDLRSDDGDLVLSLKALQQALDQLNKLASELGAEDTGLMAGIHEFNETASTLNKKVGPLIDSLQSGATTLDETAETAKKLFEEANKMVTNLNQVIEKSSKDLPDMVNKGAAAADKADDVMDSVRRMWPVRRGVADGSEDLLRTGSDD